LKWRQKYLHEFVPADDAQVGEHGGQRFQLFAEVEQQKVGDFAQFRKARYRRRRVGLLLLEHVRKSLDEKADKLFFCVTDF